MPEPAATPSYAAAGDGGEGRDGVRTDTVIVASIATATGDMTLFSLPRNLEDLPFPADSPLAEVYPDGFDAGNEGGYEHALRRVGDVVDDPVH